MDAVWPHLDHYFHVCSHSALVPAATGQPAARELHRAVCCRSVVVVLLTMPTESLIRMHCSVPSRGSSVLLYPPTCRHRACGRGSPHPLHAELCINIPCASICVHLCAEREYFLHIYHVKFRRLMRGFQFFPLYNEMWNNSQKRMTLLIGSSIGGATITYEIIGILGYLTFGSKVRIPARKVFAFSVIDLLYRSAPTSSRCIHPPPCSSPLANLPS